MILLLLCEIYLLKQYILARNHPVIIMLNRFTGMKLAQKNRETSCLPHGKLGRCVPRSGRRDNPCLHNLRGERCQTLNLLKEFSILLVFCFLFFIISVVTILEAFYYFLHLEQIFIFCSFFGNDSRNTELAVTPLLHCLSFQFGTPPHPKSLLLFAVIFLS